jgi:hypothetical protein
MQKLRPDRDLQCYFFKPSTIAALSETSEDGFSLSGSFRQQFDWAVIEWNRDNVFEHPLFRNLPDGDLSGLTLGYEEERTNCIPMDSDLFPTVDWPSLRIWATENGVEDIYYVTLKDHAEPIEGSYVEAEAEITLGGSASAGDTVGFHVLTEAYTHEMQESETLDDAAQALIESVNASSSVITAVRDGTTIILTLVTPGSNGNRLGLYTYNSAGSAATWDVAWRKFSGGESPSKWSVTIDFTSLTDRDNRTVPTASIRKIRWTYAADLEDGAFTRKEFSVAVSNWTVTGTGRGYEVAGAGSERVEDDAAGLAYSGMWTKWRGNFSGNTMHYASANGASVTCTYRSGGNHTLYVGTLLTVNSPQVSIVVDGGTPVSKDFAINDDNILARVPAGEYGAGSHTVTITHAGTNGQTLYFDFIEAAIPVSEEPELPAEQKLTLATDWDTDHSLALAPERTAWMLNSLGFKGRANNYAGALWFFELVRAGHEYASASVTFSGTPTPASVCEVVLDGLHVQHEINPGDTSESVCTWFWLEFNRGYTGVRATRSGSVLTIWARRMGTEGNGITISTSPTTGDFTLTASSSTIDGGVNGHWRPDLTASPRINRAARDWSRSYYAALDSYGIDVAAAFSTELKYENEDDLEDVEIVQRGPEGDPIFLPTPAVQTNFSAASLDFWKEVYKGMAEIQADAGITPYLQFGEVQWWYFPHDGLGTNFSGMPFYDAWTQSEFQSRYAHAMAVITANTVDPLDYPDESEFLPAVIGEFTSAVMDHVRDTYPDCRFEVLYPTDVNQTAFNRAINFPESAWTPSALTCLKTESFGFTFNRNLNQGRSTIEFGESLGWPNSQRAHLVGLMDATTPWLKEARMAEGENFESVVLFALDQMCLIGYPAPLKSLMRRAVFMGA